MFRVLTCLTVEHDWRLVVLAGVVCLIASMAAVSPFHRARATMAAARAGWIAIAGVATGFGIWATHFIAMLAYEPGFATAYDIGLTALSLFAAVVITSAGLALAVYGPPRWSALAGGAIVGAGIACMHYLGMWALQLPGRVSWSLDLVLVSIGLAILFGAAALAIAVRGNDMRATFTSALLLTLAVVAHHFTAMGAIEILPDPTRAINENSLSPRTLAFTIAGAAIAFFGMCLVGAFADSRLRKRDRLLRTAVSHMSQGLVMFDASARLVVCNDRYIKMYGMSPEIVKPGCTLRQLIEHRIATGSFSSADPEQYMADLRAAIAAGRTVTNTVEQSDGRTIEVSSQPMGDGGWVATHDDITELKRREASFRLLFKGNPVPMFVYDLESFHFLAVNDAAVAHYGYSREQFLASTVLDIRPAEDRERFAQAVRETRGNSTSSHTWRHRKSDGSLFEAQGYARALSYEGREARLVAVIDVTERKRAEDELRRTKKFLDTVVENMPATLVVKKADDLKYMLVNRAGEELLGISRDDLIGKTAHDYFPKAEADLITARDHKVMNTGQNSTEEITIHTRKKGARDVTSRRVAVAGDDGKPTYLLNVVDDTTERKRAEDELRRTREFLNTVVENVPATIIVKDARDLRYVLINRAGEEFYGVKRDDVIGKTAYEVFPKASADLITMHDKQLLQSGKRILFDSYSFETPSNGTRLVTTKRVPILGDKGELQYLMDVVEDITERKQAEARIAHLAHHDTLTELPNRTAFSESVAETLERAAKAGESLAIICIDLDRFKEINDVYGHSVGDALLCEVARRLQAASGGAFLARLGGDEFTVVASCDAQSESVVLLADRLLAAVTDDIEIEGQRLRTSLSIGVAIYPTDGTEAMTLLSNADAALYRAKADGRGTVRFFQPDMDKRLRERRALQRDLQSAIANGELELYYQPQALIGGEIVGFETLVRWQHPSRGTVPPDTFVPISEESGLIVPIGEWILREACREAASWTRPLRIAVNLSPVQFRHGDLPGMVHAVLLETGLAPNRLEFEITEGVLIGDFSRAVSILRRLKTLGVRIAMDDFGTGYSSLSYLQSFPFDKIKIDQAFISNLARNPQSAAIVRAIIGLGHGLNLPVVAEGVETKEQLAFLAREACDEVQGYLVGRPGPIDNYAEAIGRKPPAQKRLALVG